MLLDRLNCNHRDRRDGMSRDVRVAEELDTE
jgi:hypothetical protein